jgi:hypothetical protein
VDAVKKINQFLIHGGSDYIKLTGKRAEIPLEFDKNFAPGSRIFHREDAKNAKKKQMRMNRIGHGGRRGRPKFGGFSSPHPLRLQVATATGRLDRVSFHA